MTLIIFLLVLSVVVLIHELGHYVAAKLFRIRVYEFGFGFPPRAIGFVRPGKKWKRTVKGDEIIPNATIWSLNWLPLGGFVRLKGEKAGETGADAMTSKPAWQQAIVILAGVIMNWILAAVLICVMFMVGVETDVQAAPSNAHITNQHIVVSQVLPNSPASTAGIQAGDVVQRAAGAPVTVASALQQSIKTATSIELQLLRDDKPVTVTVSPTMITGVDHPIVGVALTDVGRVQYPFMSAVTEGARTTWLMSKMTLGAFGGLIRTLAGGHVPPDVTGPVGIAVMTGQAARAGADTLIWFIAILSINLAVLNVLPIPALDGGRLLFLMIAAIRRKPMSHQLEVSIHNVAFLILLVLIVLVSIKDIVKLGVF